MSGGTQKVAPIHILRLRAEARAMLFWTGDDWTLGEALDPLFFYAQDAGLIDTFGRETIEDIIHSAFGIELA
jgi:hypothetical protein